MRLTVIPGFSSLAVASLVALAACGDTAQEPRFPDAPPAPAPPFEDSEATRVPQRPSNADVRAELEAAQRKNVSIDVAHGDGSAEAGASGDGGDTADAPGPTADADADGEAATPGVVDVERRDFETKARERLARIEARARELKQKAAKLTATKRTSFEATLRRAITDRSDVETKLGALAKSAAWKTRKATVERGLDELESTLAKLDDQM